LSEPFPPLKALDPQLLEQLKGALPGPLFERDCSAKRTVNTERTCYFGHDAIVRTDHWRAFQRHLSLEYCGVSRPVGFP
jgi:hypothetical protein